MSPDILIWATLVASTLLQLIVACAFAWFILSRFLEGRALIIASAACAVAFGLGAASYSGPWGAEAVKSIVRLGLNLIFGILIARIWLARFEKRLGAAHG